jgi:hypothetical protein
MALRVGQTIRVHTGIREATGTVMWMTATEVVIREPSGTITRAHRQWVIE